MRFPLDVPGLAGSVSQSAAWPETLPRMKATAVAKIALEWAGFIMKVLWIRGKVGGLSLPRKILLTVRVARFPSKHPRGGIESGHAVALDRPARIQSSLASLDSRPKTTVRESRHERISP